MKVTLRHGLYKNLPTDTVYNSQAACLILTLGLAFKVSAAPGVVCDAYGSSTLWAYIALAVLELAITIGLFMLITRRADDLLRLTSDKAYKLVNFFVSIWLTAKGVFYFSYCVSYLTHELFGGVEPSLVYVLFVAPVAYLGIKGIRSISRTAEIITPLMFLLVLFNLIFLKTNIDFGRNLPVFSMPEKDFFAGLPRYGLWLTDAFPLVYLRIKNKRMPYISMGLGLTALTVLVVVMLGVAVYGESLKTVSDLLVHMAGFNMLSLQIGRMEWTNLFGVIAFSIISLAFLFFGANSAFERATGSSLATKIIFPVAVAAVAIFVPSAQSVADFSVGKAGYALFAMATGLPLFTMGLFLVKKRRHSGLYRALDAEYKGRTISTTPPDSLADNIMYSFKEEAKREMSALPTGELKEEK